MSILDKIISHKRDEVNRHKERVPLNIVKENCLAAPATRGFAEALRSASPNGIIAEIKKSSPSRGIIRADLNPVDTAISYAKNGATCLSILTDSEFFSGSLKYISEVRHAAVQTPILRKDFIIDTYQVWETRASGADAILLIVSALEPVDLELLFLESQKARLDVLIETHNEEELDLTLNMISRNRNECFSFPLIGVNNRDLKSFTTDLGVTREVFSSLKEKLEAHSLLDIADELITISESGIYTAEDIKQLQGYHACAFLIGESLVAKGDPGENLKNIISNL